MHYFATDADGPKTGDVGNHALRIVEDGVVGTIAASPAEIDATNAPGMYKVAITAAENTADVVTLCGKSSTSGVTISPSTWTNITNADANVAAILVDTGTTLDGKIDAIDTVVDANRVDIGTLIAYGVDISGKAALILTDTAVLGASPIAANVVQVNGSADVPVVQEQGSLVMQIGECAAGCSATSVKCEDGTLSSTNDVYNGRTLVYTTGLMKGEGTAVTDYNGLGKTFTVNTCRLTPADGDKFILLNSVS
jgi:hypothetical protein